MRVAAGIALTSEQMKVSCRAASFRLYVADCIGVPDGIRTRVTAVKGRCPNRWTTGTRRPAEGLRGTLSRVSAALYAVKVSETARSTGRPSVEAHWKCPLDASIEVSAASGLPERWSPGPVFVGFGVCAPFCTVMHL